jgi:hypothetical protein
MSAVCGRPITRDHTPVPPPPDGELEMLAAAARRCEIIRFALVAHWYTACYNRVHENDKPAGVP